LTIKDNDGLEIALDKQTKQSLTLQKPNTEDHIGAEWTAPNLTDPSKIRPTELEVSNGNPNTQLQYCTIKPGDVPILRAAVGDDKYNCARAVVFVRFIYTETVDKLSQTVKIGLYSTDDLALMGWLQRKDSGELSTVLTYESATQYTLKRDSGSGGPFKVGNRAPPLL
jgi:hypothetical protein